MKPGKKLRWYEKIKLFMSGQNKLIGHIDELHDYINTMLSHPLDKMAERMQELDQTKVYYIEIAGECSDIELQHIQESLKSATRGVGWTVPKIILINKKLEPAGIITDWTNPTIVENVKDHTLIITGIKDGNKRVIECKKYGGI